jgi:hypothetical protein
MKISNTAITIIITALLSRLGFLAVTAALAGAFVIWLGPARLRSLPRPERKLAAVHLLAMLGAAAAAIIFALAASIAGGAAKAAMASLAAWMCITAVPLIAAFHFVSFPPRIAERRQAVAQSYHLQCEALRKAS